MSVETAYEKAKAWCVLNPKWKPICEIKDSDSLLLSWGEIAWSEYKHWKDTYGDLAEKIWQEFGHGSYRCRFGYIGEDGKFYTRLERWINMMMVFEVDGDPGIYQVAGMKTKSMKRGKR